MVTFLNFRCQLILAVALLTSHVSMAAAAGCSGFVTTGPVVEEVRSLEERGADAQALGRFLDGQTAPLPRAAQLGADAHRSKAGDLVDPRDALILAIELSHLAAQLSHHSPPPVRVVLGPLAGP